MANEGRAAWREFDTEWFKLPIKLRRRWWAETRYGENSPSEELLKAMREALKETTDGK